MDLVKLNDLRIEDVINDPDYRILSNGEIWSKKRKKDWIKLSFRNKNGYLFMAARKGFPKLAVHRIIYRKFIGSLDSSLVINHKDGNPSNNSASNLELVSVAENNLHRFQVLQHKPVAGHRKIDPIAAEEIRQLRKSGLTYNQILSIVSVKFGITSKGTISEIVNNKIWNKEVTLGNI